MIKSTVHKKESSSNYYPKLKISPFGSIVLFVSSRKGTVIHPAEESDWEMGHFSELWDEYNFKDYHGSVTLETN